MYGMASICINGKVEKELKFPDFLRKKVVMTPGLA